ncbi:MAG: hypothetical protein ACYDEQ_14325, partial [Desulfocucumaceae bacterium]
VGTDLLHLLIYIHERQTCPLTLIRWSEKAAAATQQMDFFNGLPEESPGGNMLNVILISLIFIFIIALEAPGMIKKKMWRELTVFSTLLLIGMVYSFGLALNIPMPNPTDAIMTIFEPVSKYFDKVLS